MIQTSRNVSTFCDTFPHQLRGCVLSKLDGIRGTHCGESGSECACRRKARPLSILHASDSRSTHIGQAPTAPLRRASISEGKGLSGLLQYSCNLWHSSAQARRGWPNMPGFISLAYWPPAWWQWLPGTLMQDQSLWGKRTRAQLEYCGSQTHPGTQKGVDKPGLPGLWDPWDQKQGLDMSCKLCSVTHVNRRLLFQQSLQLQLYSLWLTAPDFCPILFGEFLPGRIISSSSSPSDGNVAQMMLSNTITALKCSLSPHDTPSIRLDHIYIFKDLLWSNTGNFIGSFNIC